MPGVLGTIGAILGVIGTTIILPIWWLWLFLILFWIASQVWLAYRQARYERVEPKLTLFEIFVPRELRKAPQAMEQVFMSIYGIRNSPANAKEKWWDGEVPLWFSFEIASFGGELHIYIVIPQKHRSMVQAAFYAHYTDIEIKEVSEDYLNRFPPTVEEILAQRFEIFGNELILGKDDVYPIRTYREFQEPEEELTVDPIAPLLETMAKINLKETVLVQILIQPVIENTWIEKGKKEINKIKEETAKRQVRLQTGAVVVTDRTPGERDLIEALEKNIGKPAFETTLRYMYLSPVEVYSDGFARRGTRSAFNQYSAKNRNEFDHNIAAWTRTQIWFWPYIFPRRRGFERKRRMWKMFRERDNYAKTFMGTVLRMRFFHWGIGAWQRNKKMILNVEELATIFHLPTNLVLTGPLIRRVEARRMGPPAELPIYGEGGDEEKLPGVG